MTRGGRKSKHLRHDVVKVRRLAAHGNDDDDHDHGDVCCVDTKAAIAGHNYTL